MVIAFAPAPSADRSAGGACAAGELVAASVARLAEVDLDALSAAEQSRLLVSLSRAESALIAVRLRLLAAADRSQTAARVGAASTGQWAAGLTHTDTASSHREVGLGRSLEDLPTTRTALGDGEMSPAHAAVIAHALDQLPAGLTPAQKDRVEEALVAKATELDPPRLRRVARRALEAIEPDSDVVDAHEDGLVRDEETRARQRTRLTLHDHHDGTVSGHFTIPTLHGHLLRKVIEAMTAPRRGRLGAPQAQTGPAQGPRTDWAHARGTAFCELLEHLPTDHLHPHTAATVIVTMRDDVLQGQVAAAGLDTGETISSGEARRIACGSGLIPAVLDSQSIPLDLGRTKRLFTHTQRLALGLTHHTCAADGCQRPYAWCELHHQQPWAHHGTTDLTNATPLCHFHHQRIHDPHYTHTRQPDDTIRFHRRT